MNNAGCDRTQKSGAEMRARYARLKVAVAPRNSVRDQWLVR
jgi:hypothetical protein